MTATASPLDRRRDKAGAAEQEADKTQAAVTDIDNQLHTLDGLAEQQKQALRRATDEAARLKRSIKAAGKRREQLQRARKKAVTKAGKARAKARTAEAKYDKQVLAELVRREKEKDRSAPPEPETTSPAREVAASVTAAKVAPPARTPRRTPAPERENAATTTARRTAARKTARS